YSARSIPIIRSRDPLWDNADLGREVEDGRDMLPNAPSGTRETLITSLNKAEPQYVKLKPGTSPWTPASAVFTAGFFLSLTVQAYPFAIFCGVVTLFTTIRWLWETDHPTQIDKVDAGAGIVLPVAIAGPRSHGWWALNVLFTVIGMIGFL